MTFSAVLPYFRARITAQGFTEWTEPFDAENIPSTLIDKAFHIDPPTFSGVVRDMNTQEFDATVAVSLFFKGFREPALALDESLVKAESAIVSCLNPVNFEGTELTGVFVNSVEFAAFDDELNDNIVVALMTFNVKAYVCI